MDHVTHSHPPCSVSDHNHSHGDIIIMKLIIQTQYEGKEPPFDADCKKNGANLQLLLAAV